ncbi:MAG: hypothetical protein WC400_03770 [Patescibacteria group bacterium]|jgi:hypothetical protein
MAKKKRVKRAPKSQGVTINWAVVGLVVVIALLIGLWQINGKPQSQAASDQANWPKVVSNLNADIRLDKDVSLSWSVIEPAAPYEIVGYRVKTTPAGATASKTFDLTMAQIGKTQLQGQQKTIYYATVNDAAMLMATHGTVELMPIMTHPVYAPNSKEVEYAGVTTNAILDY